MLKPALAGTLWHHDPTICFVYDHYLGKPAWNKREDLAWYLDRCLAKGFVTNEKVLFRCAERWLAGKRKISPPGTKKAKRLSKQLKKDVPEWLVIEVKAWLLLNPNPTEKLKNYFVGQVMKNHKEQKPNPIQIKGALDVHQGGQACVDPM